MRTVTLHVLHAVVQAVMSVLHAGQDSGSFRNSFKGNITSTLNYIPTSPSVFQFVQRTCTIVTKMASHIVLHVIIRALHAQAPTTMNVHLATMKALWAISVPVSPHVLLAITPMVVKFWYSFPNLHSDLSSMLHRMLHLHRIVLNSMHFLLR